MKVRRALFAALVALAMGSSGSAPAEAQDAAPSSTAAEAGLYPIFEKGAFGFIDRSGAVVIEPSFESGQDFSDGLALVRVGKRKWGAIDTSGKLVVPAEFEYLRSFVGGFAPAKKQGLWGIIDAKGTWVVEPRYERIGGVSEGAASFKKDGKWGLVGVDGKILVPPRFDHLSSPRQGWCIVKGEGRYYFIDTSGKTVLDPVKLGNIAWEFEEGLTPIRMATRKGGKRMRWGYIDRGGKLVIKAKFNRAHRFSEGLAEVEVTPKDGFKWGYIDKTGKVVIKPQWHSTGPFSNGRALVKVGEKWGYIDTKGKMVIPATFDWAADFEDGLARVELHDCDSQHRDERGVCTQGRRDKVGYIDLEGVYVREPVSKR